MKVLRAAAEATAAAAAAAATPPPITSTEELSGEKEAEAHGESPNEIIDLSRKDNHASTDFNRNDIKHEMGRNGSTQV